MSGALDAAGRRPGPRRRATPLLEMRDLRDELARARTRLAVGRAGALTLGLALGLVLGIAPAASTRAQPPVAPPVRVEVDGAFGDDALVGGGYASVIVEATNTTSTAFRGRVVVRAREWRSSAETYEVGLDLPAGETRRVLVTIFARDSAEIEARYEDELGRNLGLGSQTVSYGAGAPTVVLVEDRPIHRAELLELQTNIGDPTGAYGYMGGSERTVDIPIGTVTSDARTGDPLLPDTALGYSTVAVLCVSVPMTARMSEAQLRAIEGYVHAGGRLLLLPRTETDLRTTLVSRFFDGVTSTAGPARSTLVPEAARALGCPPGSRVDGGGCSRSVGFGGVWLSPVEVALDPTRDHLAFRELVSAIVEHDATSAAVLRHGLGEDRAEESWMYGSGGAPGAISDLRAALDPNEGYRASLVLIAVLLFLYVILVGPVNFRLVERRSQPTLALLTTPLLALGCAGSLLFVGYVGKGVTMRTRRLEILELSEGESLASARRYTGWFFTRPASLDVEGPPRGAIRETLGTGASPTVRLGATRTDLVGLRAGLWETPITREDHLVDLGGTVRFELDETRLAGIVNETRLALRGVVVVDNVGAAYAVGDVPAGGRAPIPTSTGVFVTEPSGYYGGDDDTALASLRQALSLTSDDDALARGIAGALGSELVGSLLPTVYAWAEPDAGPTSSPEFAVEWDRRLLRVVPDYPASTLGGALPPLPEALPTEPDVPSIELLQRMPPDATPGAGGPP